MADINFKVDTLFKRNKRKVHTQNVPFFNEPILTGNQVVPTDIWTKFSELPKPRSTSTLIQNFVKVSLTLVPGSTNSFYDVSRGVVDLIDPLLVDGSYSVKIYNSIDVEIPSGQNDWYVDYVAGVVTFSDGVSGIDVSSGITITAYKYIGPKGVGDAQKSVAVSFKALMTNHGLTNSNLPKAVRRNAGGTWVLAQANSLLESATHVIVSVSDSNTVEIASSGRFELPSHGLAEGKLYSVSQTTPGSLVLSTSIVSGIGNTILLVEGSNFIHVLQYKAEQVGGLFYDGSFILRNTTDITKQLKFSLGSISTSTTRTLTMPNYDVDLGSISTIGQTLNGHLDSLGNKHDAFNISFSSDLNTAKIGTVLSAITDIDTIIGVIDTSYTYIGSGTSIDGYLELIGTELNKKIFSSTIGQANGVAGLDGTGKIPTNQLPNSLTGSVSYQGTWNASTNSPDLSLSSPLKGYYYVVDTAGGTVLGSNIEWKAKDWAIYNGSTWDKVDNTESVVSVNGFSGSVVLNTSHISENTNLYFTNSRARTASVVNSFAGTETDQAPSVQSIKTNVVGTPSGSGDTLEKLENKINNIYSSEIDTIITPGTFGTPTNVHGSLSWNFLNIHAVTLDYTILVKTTNRIRTGTLVILFDGTQSQVNDRGYSIDNQDVFVDFTSNNIGSVVNLQSQLLSGEVSQGTYAVRFYNIKPIQITS